MLLNRTKALALMEERGIDALVLAYTENVMYFSDFLRVRSNHLKSRLSYVVFFADEALAPALLVPHQDYLETCEHTWIQDVRKTSEYPIPGNSEVAHDKPELIASIIAERGLKGGRIGFEEQSLPYQIQQQLQSKLEAFELVPASGLLHKLRAIKSPQELELIKRAMRFTEIAGQAILNAVRPGISEAELGQLAIDAALEAGADAMDFVIVGAEEHGAVVHGEPRDYILKEGDLVRFDLGALSGGYPGDLARTFVVGDIVKEDHARHYGAVRAAVEAGIAAVRPGITAGEIYEIQMQAGQKIDPELKREHAGHGLGLEVHEEPMIYSGNDFVLEPGMVLMIENARYLTGKAGYQLEDLVLVTEDGHELLTSLPHDLVIPKA